MSERGYTLVGILVYVAIVSTALLSLGAIFRAGLETGGLVGARAHLRESAAFAVAVVRERMEEAGAVTTPLTGSASTLSMDAPDPAESPVTFAVSDGRLVMTLGALPPEPITPADVTVDAFTATRLSGSPASVRLRLDLSKAALPARATFFAESTLTLRYD